MKIKDLHLSIRLKLGGPARPPLDRPVFLKGQRDMLQVMLAINDILKQFKETNLIFDRLISPTYVNCLVGALVYPSFLFFDFPYSFKLFIVVLWVWTMGVNCFIITIFNECFIRNVSTAQCGRFGSIFDLGDKSDKEFSAMKLEVKRLFFKGTLKGNR